MRYEIFSIFDGAAVAFFPPVFLATEALLTRELIKVRDRNPDHVFVKHSEQFTVFKLGEFDDSTGVITTCGQEAVVNLKVLFARGQRPTAVDSVQVVS